MRQDDVRAVIADGGWWSLRGIAEACGEDGKAKRTQIIRILDAFARYEMVEVRRVPTPYKCGNPTIREWRWVYDSPAPGCGCRHMDPSIIGCTEEGRL